MDKTEFIGLLECTLVNAGLDVTKLVLLDDNTVQVTFKGNGTRNINIEADSYGAIILDVVNRCF